MSLHFLPDCGLQLGRASVSPADASPTAEAFVRRIQTGMAALSQPFDFGEALRHMRAGRKVKRHAQTASLRIIDGLIYEQGEDNVIVPIETLDIEDVLAIDWEVSQSATARH